MCRNWSVYLFDCLDACTSAPKGAFPSSRPSIIESVSLWLCLTRAPKSPSASRPVPFPPFLSSTTICPLFPHVHPTSSQPPPPPRTSLPTMSAAAKPAAKKASKPAAKKAAAATSSGPTYEVSSVRVHASRLPLSASDSPCALASDAARGSTDEGIRIGWMKKRADL